MWKIVRMFPRTAEVQHKYYKASFEKIGGRHCSNCCKGQTSVSKLLKTYKHFPNYFFADWFCIFVNLSFRFVSSYSNLFSKGFQIHNSIRNVIIRNRLPIISNFRKFEKRGGYVVKGCDSFFAWFDVRSFPPGCCVQKQTHNIIMLY